MSKESIVEKLSRELMNHLNTAPKESPRLLAKQFANREKRVFNGEIFLPLPTERVPRGTSKIFKVSLDNFHFKLYFHEEQQRWEK